jgi:hypothetical protein
VEGAGRSVWYDRRLRKAEAGGSNPPRSTTTASFNTFVNFAGILKDINR